MYALALLTYDAQEADEHWGIAAVHDALVSAVPRIVVGRFEVAEREQILIYVSMLHTLVPHDDHFHSTDARDRSITWTFSVSGGGAGTGGKKTSEPAPLLLQASVINSLARLLKQRNSRDCTRPRRILCLRWCLASGRPGNLQRDPHTRGIR